MKKFVTLLLLITIFACCFVGCGEKNNQSQTEQSQTQTSESESSNSNLKFDENEEIKDFVKFQTWFFTSGVPNNLIVFETDEKNASFECTVTDGYFYGNEENEQQINIPNKTTVSWVNSREEGSQTNSYIDVILYVDNVIKGACIIQIEYDNEKDWYEPKVVITKFFEEEISREQV